MLQRVGVEIYLVVNIFLGILANLDILKTKLFVFYEFRMLDF